MAAMMRVTTNNVWVAVFKAEDHPQAVIALGLTGLTHGRVADLSEAYDYRIHADRGAVSKHYKIHFDRWSDDYDSVVQLFVDSPEEAKWIPILEQALKSG